MPLSKHRLHEIVFEAETRAGRAFDLLLLIAILLSVLVVCLESVPSIGDNYGVELRAAEWVFTALFTIEYLARLYCVTSPLRYATSFFGMVDLVAILPVYLSLVFGTSLSLATIRILRLVRVFRVMKLARFLGEASVLRSALRASVPKIIVFLLTILCIDVIVGSAMYVIEGPEHGFSSIPQSMYWAIVTMTTVGYGDLVPETPLGQTLASGLMLCGYAILAVPTGIVSAEIVRLPRSISTQACPNCSAEGHEPDSKHCRFCGAKL